MQNKNNHTDVGERNNNSPTENFSIENVPVYSMKKDLEIIANPVMTNQNSAPSSVSLNPRYTSTPKSSSFLKKPETTPTPTISISPKKSEAVNKPAMIHLRSSSPVSASLEYTSPSKISPFLEETEAAKKPTANKEPLNQELSESSKQNVLKKVFIFSIILLSLAALGVGSYYFWLARGEKSEIISEKSVITVPISTSIEEPSLPAAIVEPDIKAEGPKENVLILDLANSNLAEIKTAIENQIKKLPRESFNEPIEFKLRDSQNNLLLFSSFAKKSNMAFPQSLSAYLGESFSLFFFNDGSHLGTGLIIESKNDSLLAQAVFKEELSLPKNLDVLFLPTAPEKTSSISFSNSIYKDTPMRYFNLISQEGLSIDYAVAKNKFIIGTTRNTFAALFDWLLLQLEAKQPF